MLNKSKNSSTIKRQMQKEINDMHKATADFVELCMDIAKTRTKGIKKIEKNVSRVIANMARLDNIYKKYVK